MDQKAPFLIGRGGVLIYRIYFLIWLEVVSKPHLPAVKSGILHLFLILKVLRRPNSPPEIFGGLQTSSKFTAHPPTYSGGLRFFIGLRRAPRDRLGA
jgi:hypothetical protein